MRFAVSAHLKVDVEEILRKRKKIWDIARETAVTSGTHSTKTATCEFPTTDLQKQLKLSRDMYLATVKSSKVMGHISVLAQAHTYVTCKERDNTQRRLVRAISNVTKRKI